MMRSTRLLVLLALSAAPCGAQAPLELAAPIETWDEALPLGNGLTGGLVWGGGNLLRLSLDRGDLWDLRGPAVREREEWCYATMRRLVAAGDQKQMVALFDRPYQSVAYPTKLPGGRLELSLAAGCTLSAFRLDLRRAEAFIACNAGSLRAFYSAVAPVAMLRLPRGVPAPVLRIVRPAGLDRLGYAPAAYGKQGSLRWMAQEAALGLRYAVVVGTKERAGALEIAVAITSNRDGEDPVAIGRERVSSALETGYGKMLVPHLRWWKEFWGISSVALPEPAIQAHYDLVKYFYGAASRRGAPPMPLQGVWTADAGGLPPWKGDYHNDLNTQMTYLAYPAAGLFEEGLSFLEFNWKLLPAYRAFARRFFGISAGALVPGVMALDGSPMGGWSQYALSPTAGAWIAYSFYLHWRTTMDRGFLAGCAYPWCREVGTALAELLHPDESGHLVLPLSSSPEIFNNSMRAWLPPNSNYDSALLRWLFGALERMAAELGEQGEAARWKELRAKLAPLDVDPQSGALTFAAGLPYHTSHRHFSHLMAIHPLGILNIEGSERDRAVIDASLDQVLARGTRGWVGYSFSWMACILARCARPEQALKHLRDFVRAFILRNGFHVNGDQTRSGLSGFTYRPFTLEGNFLAMEAVHEMLLQSWGGRVRIFPAVSASWGDVSFEDLRARGGLRVSAERRGGRTVRVRLVAGAPVELRLADPFGGAAARWNREGIAVRGGEIRVHLESGEELSGGLEEGSKHGNVRPVSIRNHPPQGPSVLWMNLAGGYTHYTHFHTTIKMDRRAPADK